MYASCARCGTTNEFGAVCTACGALPGLDTSGESRKPVLGPPEPADSDWRLAVGVVLAGLLAAATHFTVRHLYGAPSTDTAHAEILLTDLGWVVALVVLVASGFLYFGRHYTRASLGAALVLASTPFLVGWWIPKVLWGDDGQIWRIAPIQVAVGPLDHYFFEEKPLYSLAVGVVIGLLTGGIAAALSRKVIVVLIGLTFGLIAALGAEIGVGAQHHDLYPISPLVFVAILLLGLVLALLAPLFLLKHPVLVGAPRLAAVITPDDPAEALPFIPTPPREARVAARPPEPAHPTPKPAPDAGPKPLKGSLLGKSAVRRR